jgi:uncharacterized protein
VTIIVDTAPIVTLSDVRDPKRRAVTDLLQHSAEVLVVPAPVTAEIDYFLSTRYSQRAARGFIADIVRGRFDVQCLTTEEYATVLDLGRRYGALAPGLADLSVVVLAARYGTRRLLTFDHRHFRAMEPLQGGTFTLLPDDGDP